MSALHSSQAVLLASLLATLLCACGGAAATASEPAPVEPVAAPSQADPEPRSAGLALCGGPLPEMCGIELEDCGRRLDALIVQCARAMLATAEIAEPNREQLERAAGLGMLCAGDLLVEQRALEGYACTVDSGPQTEMRQTCIVCSVALGLRPDPRVAP